MVTSKNPEAPASSRQLYKLQQLSNKMTMQEASDMISSLETRESGIITTPTVTMEATQASVKDKKAYTRAPFTETHVCLIEGDEGSGKSNTAVARVVDTYFKDCVRIYFERTFHRICKVKSYSFRSRVAKIDYNGRLKLLHVPKDYKLRSPMRIFSNLKFFNIPYYYLPSFTHTSEWLKNGTITDCWLILDEGYVGMNARACTTELGVKLAKQYRQFRKMQLDVIIITPVARQIDFLLRQVPTERISCEFNPQNKKITLTIRKRGLRGVRTLDYNGSIYWPFYDTNQRITA